MITIVYKAKDSIITMPIMNKPLIESADAGFRDIPSKALIATRAWKSAQKQVAIAMAPAAINLVSVASSPSL